MDMGDSNGGMQGHLKLDDIWLIDDFKDEVFPNGVCNEDPEEDGLHTVVAMESSGRKDRGRDAFILCPLFFENRAIPKKHGSSCKTWGNRFDKSMFTAASFLVLHLGLDRTCSKTLDSGESGDRIGEQIGEGSRSRFTISFYRRAHHRSLDL
jgi:hypothetical protein